MGASAADDPGHPPCPVQLHIQPLWRIVERDGFAGPDDAHPLARQAGAKLRGEGLAKQSSETLGAAGLRILSGRVGRAVRGGFWHALRAAAVWRVWRRRARRRSRAGGKAHDGGERRPQAAFSQRPSGDCFQ